MAKRSKQAARPAADGIYLGLVRTVPLRPIRSDTELDRAIAMIDSLIARDDLGLEEEDYVDVLSDLVHRYEAKHDPIASVSDAEMVRFLLESNDMTQADLAERSGIAESTISEILAEKRKLSRRHIATLARVFRVSPAVFFHEVEEMTSERASRILKRHRGIDLSPGELFSIASALAMEPHRVCWRAFQELVAGERPGTPINKIARQLNNWGEGGDCWRPSRFHLTGPDIQALADALATENECWIFFRGMFEDALVEFSKMQREFAEEN